MASNFIKKIIRKYHERFGVYGGDKVRDTYKEELIYESGKLYFTIFLGLVIWIPYIRHDLLIHQLPMLALAIRLGLSLLSVCLILLRFTKTFHHKPSALLMVFVGYIYIATSLVTATAGQYASSYIGGYVFIIMIMIIGPFYFLYKAFLSIFSVVLFLIVGYFFDLDFNADHILYSVTDLLVAVIFSLVLNYVHDRLRHRTWKQRYELQEMVVKEQKSTQIISALARKAEEANKAKSNFLATMSHEIRTPLNAILGITQIQLYKEDLPDELTESLEKINSSGKNLLGIINDVLDMSKIETGKMDINPIEYDVPGLIYDAVQLNIVRIGSKPIEFMLYIREDLPLRLIGDELRIKQILNNLLSNSIKYTEKGFVKLLVRHSVVDSGDADSGNIILRFVVEDTGQGMTQEDCQKLFSEEYLRFNIEANRATEGTGIGLNITRNLVDLMGGTIKVRSEPGKGSVFTVKIIQKSVKCEPIGHELARQLQNFTYSSQKQHTNEQILRQTMSYGNVLIVDDLETNLFVAEGLMASYGMKIDKAISGFAVLEKVESGNLYDIIFMDHMMPMMDGIETTNKLRAMGYSGVIVALTANALVGNAQMFKDNGFDDFISKPIDVRHLDDILNKYIRDKHPERKSEKVTGKSEKTLNNGSASNDVNQKLLEVFRLDAEKAMVTLQETYTNFNIKLLTTTVHAMKAALANIGEHDKSEAASKLEDAGLKGDMEFISANIDSFIASLGALVQSLRPAETAVEDNTLREDTEFLTGQLHIIMSACVNYDDTAANAALDRLNEKKWKNETSTALEKIRNMLFLHSDFDGAAEQAAALINSAAF
ncbi:MAG: ATP-binding protein [Treponema sp.]|nr:ATP-binding protein [Treponema sp.]